MRRNAARLIDLNEYLASFPGPTIADKIAVNELNEINLNLLPNSWYKQTYVQSFDWDSISFFLSRQHFWAYGISEIIYEGVVTSYYLKKNTWEEAKHTIFSRKIEEKPPCQMLAPRRMVALVSAVNNLWITWRTNRKPASSTALGILPINVRYWGDLGLSMLQSSLLSTMGATLYQGKYSRKTRKPRYY